MRKFCPNLFPSNGGTSGALSGIDAFFSAVGGEEGCSHIHGGGDTMPVTITIEDQTQAGNVLVIQGRNSLDDAWTDMVVVSELEEGTFSTVETIRPLAWMRAGYRVHSGSTASTIVRPYGVFNDPRNT